jgi:hypothetical protein
MNEQERKERIIARGEVSGHCHVVTGDNVTITREPAPAGSGKEDKVIIIVGEDSHASLRHLLERPYIEKGEEIWTQEHKDIPLAPGKYQYVQQVEYDAYTAKKKEIERLKAVKD